MLVLLMDYIIIYSFLFVLFFSFTFFKYLEAGRWEETGLVEPKPKDIFSKLPLLKLCPKVVQQQRPQTQSSGKSFMQQPTNPADKPGTHVSCFNYYLYSFFPFSTVLTNFIALLVTSVQYNPKSRVTYTNGPVNQFCYGCKPEE